MFGALGVSLCLEFMVAVTDVWGCGLDVDGVEQRFAYAAARWVAVSWA